jgi:hypothetical protein
MDERSANDAPQQWSRRLAGDTASTVGWKIYEDPRPFIADALAVASSGRTAARGG